MSITARRMKMFEYDDDINCAGQMSPYGLPLDFIVLDGKNVYASCLTMVQARRMATDLIQEEIDLDLDF